MANISSVLGPLDTADLGFTLSHEHVLVPSAGIQQVFLEWIDREGTIARAVTALKEGYREGLRSMIDLTTIDLGRDIRLIEQVSRGSGSNIICATGTWRDIPRAFFDATPDMIAPLYIREIEEGIEGTGIKAGIIKVANDVGGVTPERPSASAISRSVSSRTRVWTWTTSASDTATTRPTPNTSSAC